MSIATDHLLAQILLTVATIGYGILTVKADFNATHATNPLWTAHARFHVVWQITSYFGFGLIALALIWIAGPFEVERLYLAAAFGLVVYGSFFVAVFSRPLYGGKLYDENGYQPFRAPFGSGQWDLNTTVFGVMAAITLGGAAAI